MKDFNIGDLVRIKDTPNPEWMPKMPSLPDTIFKVEGTQNDKLILSMECSDARFIVDAEHFELVKAPSPMTAFLTELQALLEKYNVDLVVEDCGCNAALYAYCDGIASIDFWCEGITRQGLKDKQYIIYDKE